MLLVLSAPPVEYGVFIVNMLEMLIMLGLFVPGDIPPVALLLSLSLSFSLEFALLAVEI